MLTGKKQLQATLSLAGILAIRMLGLFMILPVLALYTNKLIGSTPFLIGLALGIYGFTQAVFQIPFGTWSDHIGRKRIIALGLLLFILGSLVGAFSSTIHGVIVARALQGMGAIGSTVMALLADIVPDSRRSRAMAVLGMTIGLAFILSMVLGPLLNNWIHLSGIFAINALLAFLALIVLFLFVPNAEKETIHKEVETVPKLFSKVLKNKQLFPLNFSIFCLHTILTATFLAIPLIFHNVHGILQHQWLIYLFILFISFFIALPFIVLSEKNPGLLKFITFLAMLLIALAEVLLFLFHNSYFLILLSLVMFFIGFNFFEACLPSQVAKIAQQQNRGTAMGIYSTSQFLGIFFGGIMGGWISQILGLTYIFIFCASLTVFWAILRIK